MMPSAAAGNFGRHNRAAEIAILGAGCAGLSLAAAASPQQAEQMLLVGPADDRPSHIWGFWQMPWLDQPARLARKSWHKWLIATPAGSHIHQADQHPYHALDSSVWLDECRRKIARNRIRQITSPAERRGDGLLWADTQPLTASRVLDARPPKARPGILLQHFLGYEITAPQDVFDPALARLMDFRTGQAKGLNFIYLLPFDRRRALVESTFFSTETQPEPVYDQLIRSYLKTQFGLTRFRITHREKGLIPMGKLQPHDPLIEERFGGNGGAVRASSGYAFGFIQKQIARMLAGGTAIARPQPPHRQLDIWMDQVFLRVLAGDPAGAPALFLALAQALDGDGLARFLSGCARLADYLAVMRAMPTGRFLSAALYGPGSRS